MQEDTLCDYAVDPPDEADDDQAVQSQAALQDDDWKSKRTKKLSVVSKKYGQGKLLYMSARPNHHSYGPGSSLWQLILPEDVRVLELELRRALKPKYSRDLKKEVKDYLRVAMVSLAVSSTLRISD